MKLVFDSKVLQVQVSPILHSLVAWLTSHSPFPYNHQVPKERKKFGPQVLGLELTIKKLAGGTVGINVLEIKQILVFCLLFRCNYSRSFSDTIRFGLVLLLNPYDTCI